MSEDIKASIQQLFTSITFEESLIKLFELEWKEDPFWHTIVYDSVIIEVDSDKIPLLLEYKDERKTIHSHSE